MRQGSERWIPATIVQIKGPSSYIVRVPGNKHRFVHTDHLMHDDRAEPIPELQSDVQASKPLSRTAPVTPVHTPRSISITDETSSPNVDNSDVDIHVPSKTACATPRGNGTTVVTRSGRKVIPPDRLSYGT